MSELRGLVALLVLLAVAFQGIVEIVGGALANAAIAGVVAT